MSDFSDATRFDVLTHEGFQFALRVRERHRAVRAFVHDDAGVNCRRGW